MKCDTQLRNPECSNLNNFSRNPLLPTLVLLFLYMKDLAIEPDAPYFNFFTLQTLLEALLNLKIFIFC